MKATQAQWAIWLAVIPSSFGMCRPSIDIFMLARSSGLDEGSAVHVLKRFRSAKLCSPFP